VIAANVSVSFDSEFRLNTASFPPVFAGTLAENKLVGQYDPAYPPTGVNLHWWYPAWPAPPENSPDENITPGSYIRHVGEYNGAWADGPSVFVT